MNRVSQLACVGTHWSRSAPTGRLAVAAAGVRGQKMAERAVWGGLPRAWVVAGARPSRRHAPHRHRRRAVPFAAEISERDTGPVLLAQHDQLHAGHPTSDNERGRNSARERCHTHPVVATAGADVVLEQSRLPPENCIAIVQATAGLAIDKRRVVDCRVVSKGDI